MERTQDWSEVERYQTLILVDRFLTRKMRMTFCILEYLYQIKCESRLLYGAEVCEVEEMEFNWLWGPWEIL